MKFRSLLPLLLLCMPGFLQAQPSADSRACNLQAREIALRISEEVSSDLTSAERGQIVDIAESVCLENAQPPRIPRPNAASVNSAPAEPVTSVQTMAIEEVEEEESVGVEEEEKSGLFGNLRVIDAKDRVQRPGLKRK